MPFKRSKITKNAGIFHQFPERLIPPIPYKQEITENATTGMMKCSLASWTKRLLMWPRTGYNALTQALFPTAEKCPMALKIGFRMRISDGSSWAKRSCHWM